MITQECFLYVGSHSLSFCLPFSHRFMGLEREGFKNAKGLVVFME